MGLSLAVETQSRSRLRVLHGAKGIHPCSGLAAAPRWQEIGVSPRKDLAERFHSATFDQISDLQTALRVLWNSIQEGAQQPFSIRRFIGRSGCLQIAGNDAAHSLLRNIRKRR